MAIDGRTAEKLRGFLRQLGPQARALLTTELERGLQRGESMPGSDLILQELRNAGPEEGRADHEGEPARLFFTFLEPFFVEDGAENVHEGRLARAAAAPIWAWICRDLLPAESAAYAENVSRLLRDDQQAKATQAANAFHDLVARSIERMLAAAQGDDKARRKLSHQVGTQRGIDDIKHVAAILKQRDVLAVLAGKLPPKIRNLSDDLINSITSFFTSTAGRQRDVYAFGLALVLSRLVSPWQLIRVGIKGAESDLPARIADTPYVPSLTIVLTEIERLVRELDGDLQRGQAAAESSLLKDIHDAARGLRTELDLGPESAAARRMAAIRGQLAVALRPEIESAPGRVRRLLRLRPNKDILPGSLLDVVDVADTEALIEFLGHCRNYANELAINEMTMRSYSEVQHYLETHVEQLLEGLRMAGKTDRAYRRSQFDAAVRFCAKIFGEEYAETLAKAADVAVAGERKAAAAKA